MTFSEGIEMEHWVLQNAGRAMKSSIEVNNKSGTKCLKNNNLTIILLLKLRPPLKTLVFIPKGNETNKKKSHQSF